MTTRTLLLLTLLAFAAPASGQALFIVTKTADTADGSCDEDCSLREAVLAANATPGPDTIRLKHSYYGITRGLDDNEPTTDDDDDQGLANDLDLLDDVTLRGLPDGSTIDANFLGRVVEVMPGVTAELIDVVLKEGRAQVRGGGVYNDGTLTLRRSQVTRSEVIRGVSDLMQGGGIYNAGTLRLIFTKVHRNRAYEGSIGGQGAGIFNSAAAMLYLYDSDVRDNVAGLEGMAATGGGLYNFIGTARIDRSFFGWNKAGAGEGSAMANRHGGSLSVHNTTVSTNGYPDAGAAIANGSDAPDVHESESKLYLFNATIANNIGGGLLNAGRATMHNTLVAGNFAGSVLAPRHHDGVNCVNRKFLNSDFSLVGDDGNCPGAIVVDNGRVFDDVLQYLAYLGGPTPIHPQRPGPYTIDTGDPERCPMWDQRQGRRPADGDLNDTEICDIGAAEANADE